LIFIERYQSLFLLYQTRCIPYYESDSGEVAYAGHTYENKDRRFEKRSGKGSRFIKKRALEAPELFYKAFRE